MRYFAKIENEKVVNLVRFDDNVDLNVFDGEYVEYTEDKMVYIGLEYDAVLGFSDIQMPPTKPNDEKKYYLENNIWVEIPE